MGGPGQDVVVEEKPAQEESSAPDEGRPPPLSHLQLAIAFGFIVGTIVVFWAPFLGESFWLDETGTWWFVRSTFLDALARASRFQAGAFLYYAIEWPFAAVFGPNEAALRIPSFLAMLATVWLVYRLGCTLFDRSVAALAAMAFVPMTWVIISATDARPYGLAVACLTGSSLLLIRWLDEGRTRDAIGYVLLAVATVYLHYFVGVALLAHVWHLTYRMDTGAAVSWRKVWIVWGSILALLVPLVPNVIYVMGAREGLSSPDPAGLVEVFFALVSPQLVFITALALGVAVAAKGHSSLRGIGARPGSYSFLAAWVVLPLLVLVTISLVADTNTTATRYFTSVLPAVAFFVAALIRGIRSNRAQVIVAAVIVLFTVAARQTPPYLWEDWRAASASANAVLSDPNTPVLVHSGFIEGRQIDWLSDPEKASYLSAPAVMYPVEGDVIPVPFDLSPEAEVYLERLIAQRLGTAEEFVLIARGSDPFSGWLAQRLQPRGFHSNLVANYSDQILVFEFTKGIGR